jgi:hypothetical protein
VVPFVALTKGVRAKILKHGSVLEHVIDGCAHRRVGALHKRGIEPG